MKKNLTIIALACLVTASVQAQGLVVFSSSTQNISTNNSLSQLGATAVGKTLGAGNYNYALFYSVAATTVNGSATASSGLAGNYVWTDSNWTFAGDYAASSATAGRFVALSANGDGSSTVSGLGAGAGAQFVVGGWNSALGSTISALQTALATQGTFGFVGESAVSGQLIAGNGALIPNPNTFGGTAPQLQAFQLGSFLVAPTPEPGTMALAALGGASLLLFRRRNK